MIIGLISWAIAVPLSIPLGWLFTTAIGGAIELELIYRNSLQGMVAWLVLVIVLSQTDRSEQELRSWLTKAARGQTFPPEMDPLPQSRFSAILIEKDLD